MAFVTLMFVNEVLLQSILEPFGAFYVANLRGEAVARYITERSVRDR